VLLFVVAYAVALGIVGKVADGVSLEHPDVRGALALAASQLLLILVGLALVHSGVSSLRGVGLREPARRVAAGVWALAPAGLVVVVPTIAYVAGVEGDLFAAHLTLAKAAAFVLLAILIAVNEELWFRGLLVDVLGGARRPWLAIAGSTVLFGLPHLSGNAASLLNALGVTLAVGVPFAVVRLRHGALVPMIAWHALIDTWAFLHTSSVVAQGDPSASDILVGLILPTILAAGYLSWYAGVRRREALDA
jgi:membrane protease YdiL (CAAX protease family)